MADQGWQQVLAALLGARKRPERPLGQLADPSALLGAMGGGKQVDMEQPPAPFVGGRRGEIRSGGVDADSNVNYQADAQTLLRAAQAKRRQGKPLHGALLLSQGERGAGPNAEIEARQGTGQTQQVFGLGRDRWTVFYDEDGQRHVNHWTAGQGRRRLM